MRNEKGKMEIVKNKIKEKGYGMLETNVNVSGAGKKNITIGKFPLITADAGTYFIK
jgi:hypothetical protein